MERTLVVKENISFLTTEAMEQEHSVRQLGQLSLTNSEKQQANSQVLVITKDHQNSASMAIRNTIKHQMVSKMSHPESSLIN